jgi:glutamine amidotransferase
MCRWLAYWGEPIFLDTLVFEAERSLVHQSLHATRTHVATNGDGFGVGWYGERPVPGIYRDILPAWNDPNLRSLTHQVRAPRFFAHVRASTGTATSRYNCHPFSFGPWLFMHNGQIGGHERIERRLEARLDDEHYRARLGTTDSELFFHLLFVHGLERDPADALRRTIDLVTEEAARGGVAEPFRMTAALTDGRELLAVRHATDPDPPSMYWRCRDGSLLVVSEPLDENGDPWNEVPPDRLLRAGATGCGEVQELAL